MDSAGRAQIQQLFSKMHGGTSQRGDTQRAQRQRDRWEPHSHRESQAEGDEWTRAEIQVIRPKANNEEDCSITRNGERWGGSICPRALESILRLGADLRLLYSELCERALLLFWVVKLGYHCYEGPRDWYTWFVQCLAHSYFTNTLYIWRKLSCFFREVWLWLL